MTLYTSYLSTPLGTLAIVANDQAITLVEFISSCDAHDYLPEKKPKHSVNTVTDIATENVTENATENAISIQAKQQLTEYFDGIRTEFDLPLAPKGTIFRQQTWQALLQIPYGETRYYSQQAQLMDNPKAVRAVGAANGANPIAIVIPCHRVIGKNGSLTGYAGGLDRKAWLLNFEQTR